MMVAGHAPGHFHVLPRLAPLLLSLSVFFTLNSCGVRPAKPSVTSENFDSATKNNADRMFEEGQKIFRSDTFGSEAFWSKTGLHRAIAGAKNGGIGPGLSPKQALALGLKVDVLQVPPGLATLVAANKADMDDPANTVGYRAARRLAQPRSQHRCDRRFRAGPVRVREAAPGRRGHGTQGANEPSGLPPLEHRYGFDVRGMRKHVHHARGCEAIAARLCQHGGIARQRTGVA
jgi:hypothetical protein